MTTVNLAPGLVVITGGAGGVGLAAARMVPPGHPVLLVDRNEQRLERAVKELDGSGGHVEALACDVTDREDVAAVAARAARLGPLSLLLHTAGLSPSMADARTIVRVNALGTAEVLTAFEPLLVPGSVTVVIASMAGHRRRAFDFDHLLDGPLDEQALDALVQAAADQSRPAYALSKRFCIREVERLAATWGAKGARIVSVSPGVIDTEMGQLESGATGRGNPAASLGVAAVKRLATADEIAGAALLLADRGASYITGTDLLVDGGTIAGFTHHAGQAARDGWDNPWG